MNILEIRGLKKTYHGKTEAVRGINLTVQSQEIFALLGPNGAGKTTTLKAILGLLNYTGEILIFGKSIDMVRDRVAFVPEEKNFYDYLTPEQALTRCADLLPHFNLTKARQLIEQYELPWKKRISKFSYGMKTSLYMAITFAREADLLIMDEPTWGLDPIKRDDLLEAIRQQVIDGRTILLTSHIIPEVERIADRIAIMSEGRLHFTGALDDIKSGWRLFYLPPNNVSNIPSGVTLLQDGTRTLALSNDTSEWETLRSIPSAEETVPDLNTFFQVLMRRESHVA